MNRHLAEGGNRSATEFIVSAAESGRGSVRPTRWISPWHPPRRHGMPPAGNRCTRLCPVLWLVPCVRHGPVRSRRPPAHHSSMSCLRPATGRVSFPGILAVLINSDHASAGNAVFSPLVPEHTGGRDPASLAGSVDCGRRVRIPANVNIRSEATLAHLGCLFDSASVRWYPGTEVHVRIVNVSRLTSAGTGCVEGRRPF